MIAVGLILGCSQKRVRAAAFCHPVELAIKIQEFTDDLGRFAQASSVGFEGVDFRRQRVEIGLPTLLGFVQAGQVPAIAGSDFVAG